MRLRRTLGIAVLVLAGLSALGYASRLYILTHALGWYNAVFLPRAANQPVPWEPGPASAGQAPAARPPNIVVILADDMGINDVTTHGGGYAALGVPTPAIDSIARDGVRFDQGYAGSAICTVSRAALMTGRYPWRFGVEFTPTPGAMARVLPMLTAGNGQLHPLIIDKDKAAATKGFDDLGMPASEITVAETLRARGYHTMHIGKWHLGQSKDVRPNNQGFDESLNMEGLLHWQEDDPNIRNAKQDFDPIDKFLWSNGRESVSFNGGKQFRPAKYLADYFTDEAVNAIRQNRNRPFFLYLAHWGVHTPLQATRDDYEAVTGTSDHRRRVYAGMVRSIDRSVARVLQTLREQGLEDNTIVIFTSDNGAPGYIALPEVNQPYRGWKLTFFEGGLRVPYVAKWPGHIPAGSTYAQPVSNIDILPTVAAAAGARLPADRPIDGVNLLPHLVANAMPQPPRPLFWRDGPHRALRDQNWKLIVSERPKKEWLFNLADDPTEKRNLATQQPQRLASMKEMLRAHHAGMPPSLWNSFLEGPIAIDKTSDQKMEPGDEYTYWVN